MVLKASTIFPKITSNGVAIEKDPIASAAVEKLTEAVDLLPTDKTLDPIKEDITELQADVLRLASKEDLIKATDALTLVTAAVDKLKATGSAADLKVLQDAIAAADTEIKALKAKQDSTAESLQKTTQSVADLAILVAKGVGGASSTELKLLQDKLTALDTTKADKTVLDTLDTSVKALTKALVDGVTDDELAAAIKKVNDAISFIEASLKPLVGRTLYTTLAITNAAVGDSIFIDSSGEIQLLAAPPDGSEIQLFDPWRRIKAGQNNVLLGTGDRWLLADGTYDTTPLTFTDNQLLGGSLILKYSAPTKSWSAYPSYGSPVQVSGGQSTGGDRLVTALLALLPANQWTDWPALTGADAGKPITLDSIQSSSGDDWTNRLEVDRVRQRVRSLSRYTDVQFTYEVH